MRPALAGVIAAVAAAQSVSTRDNNIYFTGANGQRIQLTSMGRDLFPALSPDGARVAFVRLSNTGGAGDEVLLMCAAEVGLGEPEPVCSSVYYREEEDPLGGFSKPLWSDDGRVVYFLADFSTRTRSLCRFDPATGKAEFLTPVDRAEGEWKTIAERIRRL